MQIGAKIRSLRLTHSMTLEDLANRTELSKGFLSQLERDLTSPSIATLMDILECLGTNLKDFFNDTTDEKTVFTAADTFEKEDAAAGTAIRWLIPNAQKNRMEPILMTLRPGAEPQMHAPHEGEEFGYVLAGSVYLHQGLKKLKVKKGDSFYLHCNTPHGLSNAGKSAATVIWVSDPPNF
jgi:transcriptional regulator with XRE-family HTH domain